jgi:Zn-dependent peptidase ImmA (M78 family)
MHSNPSSNGYLHACEIVSDLLKSHGITGPPVDVNKICRVNSLLIERQILEDPFRAYLDRSNRLIVVNSRMREARARFYIAHELGHWLLDRDMHEISYDTFAACLLMPHEWIAEDVRRLGEPALMTRYEVTAPVLRRRLKLGGLEVEAEVPF